MKKGTKRTKDDPSVLSNGQTGKTEEAAEIEDITTEQFNYEVSSTDGIKELAEEEREGEEEAITRYPSSTIKILEEKDLPFKEQAPPNYSPYFKCFLHFKNRPYSDGRRLESND